MTKSELRKHLEVGECLGDLFYWQSGQECDIYKADFFEPGDEILYVPDLYLNRIPTSRPLVSEEEIEEVLAECFTGDDLANQCEEDGYPRTMAETLFEYCDWQHPSAVTGAGELDDEEDTMDKRWEVQTYGRVINETDTTIGGRMHYDVGEVYGMCESAWIDSVKEIHIPKKVGVA